MPFLLIFSGRFLHTDSPYLCPLKNLKPLLIMQLKGLVRFFAIALIFICVYQLSFTWFVHSHENDMEAKADKWLNQYPSPEKKYADNKELQALYADTLKELK